MKPALPRELNQKVEKKPQENRKIFIGGLPKDLTLEELEGYFRKYGEIIDIAIICDKKSKEPRGSYSSNEGFGFVSYKSMDAANNVLKDYSKHYFHEKWVECKMSYPKELRQGSNIELDRNFNQNNGYNNNYQHISSSFGRNTYSKMKTDEGPQEDYGYQYHYDEQEDDGQDQYQNYQGYNYYPNEFSQSNGHGRPTQEQQNSQILHPSHNFRHSSSHNNIMNHRQGSGSQLSPNEKMMANSYSFMPNLQHVPYGYIQNPNSQVISHGIPQITVNKVHYPMPHPQMNQTEVYRNLNNEIAPSPMNPKLKSQGSGQGEMLMVNKMDESLNARRGFPFNRTYSTNEYATAAPSSQTLVVNNKLVSGGGVKRLNRLGTADLTYHGEENHQSHLQTPNRNYLLQRNMFQSFKSHSLHPEDLAGYNTNLNMSPNSPLKPTPEQRETERNYDLMNYGLRDDNIQQDSSERSEKEAQDNEE